MLVIEAKLERTSTLKTRTNLTFSTKQQLNDLEILQTKGTVGHLVFSADPIKKEVEDAMRDRKIGINEYGMTPSQRLRGVLWMLAGQDDVNYEDYYTSTMEKVIEHFKAKLE